MTCATCPGDSGYVVNVETGEILPCPDCQGDRAQDDLVMERLVQSEIEEMSVPPVLGESASRESSTTGSDRGKGARQKLSDLSDPTHGTR